LIVTGGAALTGPVIFVYDKIFRLNGFEWRVSHLIRWLGFSLPAPDNPLLIGPLLAIYNFPLWIVFETLALVLFAAVLGMIYLGGRRALDNDHDS
jgi:hypothetical protein